MDHKEEFKRLVSIIKTQAAIQGQKLTNEQMALDLGYKSQGHFNTLVGARGNVTQEHIDTLKAKYNHLIPKTSKTEVSTGDLQQELIQALKAQIKLLEAKSWLESELLEIKTSLRKMDDTAEAVALVVHETKNAATEAKDLAAQVLRIVEKPIKRNT